MYRHRSFQDFEDLGLGTSCEVSSESSSNKSHRPDPTDDDDDDTKRKYEERWRKTTQNLISSYESSSRIGNWVLEPRHTSPEEALQTHQKTVSFPKKSCSFRDNNVCDSYQ